MGTQIETTVMELAFPIIGFIAGFIFSNYKGIPFITKTWRYEPSHTGFLFAVICAIAANLLYHALNFIFNSTITITGFF